MPTTFDNERRTPADVLPDRRDSTERSSPAISPTLIICLVLVLVVLIVGFVYKARLENKPGGAADGANGAMTFNAMFAPASRDGHANNGTQPSTRTRLVSQAAPRPPSDEVVEYAYDVPAVRPVGAQTSAPTYDASGVPLPPSGEAGVHDGGGGDDDEFKGFGSSGLAVAASEPAVAASAYLLPVPLISQAIRGRGSTAATCYATPDYGVGGHLTHSEAVGKGLAFATYSTIDSAPDGGAQQLDGGRSGQLAQAGGEGGYASVQLANAKPTPGWGFGAAAAEDGNTYASIQLQLPPRSHTSENAYFASDEF
jgi:hypothetical protein